MSDTIYIKSSRGVAAYAWINRPSPTYGNYELTLRLPAAEIADIRAKCEALLAEQLPPKQLAEAKMTPFGKLKDEQETLVIKSRSKYPPKVYNAKGEAVQHAPNVGPGSVLKAEWAFEVYQAKTGKPPGLSCYLQSIQVISLKEGGAGGAGWDDDSEGEGSYTGAGAETGWTDESAKATVGDAPKTDAAPGAKKKATDF